MCNHYKKLLILIAAATLFLSGCGSSNNSPAAPGLTNPAGITVAPIDDNNPATAPAVFAVPAAINDSNEIVGSAEAVAGGVLKPTFWLVDNTGAATVVPTAMDTIVVDGFAAAHDINATGVIVGKGANTDTSIRAVVWSDKDAAPALLSTLAGGFFAAAYGVNDAGRIVGTSENIDGLLKAVRWQRVVDGTLTGPSVLPGVPASWESEANAVNADNHIAGELVDAAGISSAVVWKWDGVSSSYTALNLPVPAGFDHAVAFDLNSPADGQPLLVVGEVSDDGLSGLTHAVRWSIDASNNITVTDLGTTDRSSSASAVNNAGRAAGWENTASAVSLATSWNNPTGKATLIVTDSQAFDINNNNVVVGRSGSQGFVKLAN
jgi:probable HAF family extracellular repeat protein